MRVFVCILVVLALLPPAGAAAATVSSKPGSKYHFPALTFTAADGELNDVTLTGPSDSRRVVDSAAPVVAGSGCVQVGEHEAVCRDAVDLGISLGDGDDRVDLSGAADVEMPVVLGGAGDDVLAGSPDGDLLRGGAGGDTIFGGPGDDSIAGDDAAVFGDRLEGGPGHDELEYRDHPLPVRVDLADPAAPAGAAGEGDSQSGFEQASSPFVGPSELIGTDGDNFLSVEGDGTRGFGAGGDDRFFVGRGAWADGGPGRDQFVAGPGTEIACGAGIDSVRPAALANDDEHPGPTGLLGRDCERLSLYFRTIAGSNIRPYPAVRGARATFRIPCPDDLYGSAGCYGRVVLRDSEGRLVGKRRFRTRERRTPAIGVSLDAATTRRSSRPAGARVAVSVIVNDVHGERAETSYTVILRQP